MDRGNVKVPWPRTTHCLLSNRVRFSSSWIIVLKNVAMVRFGGYLSTLDSSFAQSALSEGSFLTQVLQTLTKYLPFLTTHPLTHYPSWPFSVITLPVLCSKQSDPASHTLPHSLIRKLCNHIIIQVSKSMQEFVGQYTLEIGFGLIYFILQTLWPFW